MPTLVNNKYDPETTVFLIHDPGHYPRFIKSITFGAGADVYYTLVCGTDESVHLESELEDLSGD